MTDDCKKGTKYGCGWITLHLMLKIFSAHLNAANVALIFNPFHIHNTTLAENEKNGKECFTARLFE